VVGLDNLSTVPDWLSDSLCRAATGEGDVRRAMYTDGQLAVFAFRRCILLNGIDVGALRGDLADRIAKIDLDRIADEARQEEKELDAQWAAAYPVILGALLSVAAETMARLPFVRLAKKPRMADFARTLAAIDQLLGTDGLSRYIEQALTMAEDSLTSDLFLARMHEIKVDMTGKASELLAKVTPDLDGWRPPKDWPKDPRSVTSLLKRNAPALRKAGWIVEDDPDSDRNHFIIWTVRHPEMVSNPHPQGPQNAETAETAENEYGQSQDEPAQCTRCGKPLMAPASQQRGICESCWLSDPDTP
jgi:hypothetical protein